MNVEERWQKCLVEIRVKPSHGLKPERLANRYGVESIGEIKELTNRAKLELEINSDYGELTLEEMDKAAERMDVTIRETVTDGGVDQPVGSTGGTRSSHERPDGTPKKTGTTLHDHIVRVRVDDTQAPNGRVVIHVEHPDHDGGVRCFYRNRTTASVASSIRSHLRTEINADLARVDIIDEAGIGLAEADLLPRRLARETPSSSATAIEVVR